MALLQDANVFDGHTQQQMFRLGNQDRARDKQQQPSLALNDRRHNRAQARPVEHILRLQVLHPCHLVVTRWFHRLVDRDSVLRRIKTQSQGAASLRSSTVCYLAIGRCRPVWALSDERWPRCWINAGADCDNPVFWGKSGSYCINSEDQADWSSKRNKLDHQFVRRAKRRLILG